jgi:hypothetical protein
MQVIKQTARTWLSTLNDGVDQSVYLMQSKTRSSQYSLG